MTTYDEESEETWIRDCVTQRRGDMSVRLAIFYFLVAGVKWQELAKRSQIDYRSQRTTAKNRRCNPNPPIAGFRKIQGA